MVDKVEEIKVQITNEVVGQEELDKQIDGLDQVDESANKTAENMDRMRERTKESGSQFAQTGIILHSYLSIIQDLLGGVKDLWSEFERANDVNTSMRKSLEEVRGSTEKAGQDMEFLRETADRLGLTFESTAKQYLNIAAAAKGTVLEGGPAREIFEAIAQKMVTLGKSSDETSNALNAVSQMMSKGVIEAEELRGQLGEAMPGALQIFADALGVSVEKLLKMSSNGELLAKDVLPRVAEQIRKTSEDSGKPVSTLEAGTNRIKNAWDNLLVSLGRAGGIGLANQAVGALSGTLTVAATGVNVLSVAFNGFKEVIQTVAEITALTVESIRDADFSGFGGKLQGILDESANRINKFNEQIAQSDSVLKSLSETNAEAAERLRRTGEEARGTTAHFKDMDDAAKQLGTTLPKATKDALDGFERLKVTAQDVGKVIETLVDENTFDKGIVGIANLNATMDQMRGNVSLTQSALQEGLGSALADLSSDKLAKFRESATQAFIAGQHGAFESGISARNYGDAIQAYMIANLKKVGLTASDAFNVVSNETKQAVGALENLGRAGILNASVLDKSFSAILEGQVKTRADAELLEKTYVKWAAASGASASQINEALDKIRDSTKKLTEQQQASIDQFTRYSTVASNLFDALKESASADQRAAEAAKSLAEAKGFEIEARRKALDSAKAGVEQLKAEQLALLAQIEQYKVQKQQIIDLAGGIESLTATQTAEIQTINLLIAAKDKDVEATATQIKQNEQFSTSQTARLKSLGSELEAYNSKLEQSFKGQAAVTASTDEFTAALDRMRQGAGQNSRELQFVADGLRNMADTSENTRDLFQAQTKQAAQDLHEWGQAEANFLNQIVNAVQQYGQKATEWLLQIKKPMSDLPPILDTIQTKLNVVNAQLDENRKISLTTATQEGDGMNKFIERANLAIKFYNEQKFQVESLNIALQDMLSTGTTNTVLLNQAIEATNGEMELLDEKDLAGLKQNIAQVIGMMQTLTEETKRAAEEAEFRLAQARVEGDEIAQKRLDLERTLKEIEDERQLAEKQNNQAALDNLAARQSAEQDLFDLEVKRLETQQKAQTQAQQQTSSGQQGQSAQVGQTGQTRTGTVNNNTINLPVVDVNSLSSSTINSLARRISDELQRISSVTH